MTKNNISFNKSSAVQKVQKLKTAKVKKDLYKNDKINFGTKLGLSKNHIKILKNCQQKSTAKELMQILGFTNLTKFRRNYLNQLLDEYREVARDVNNNPAKQMKIDNDGKPVYKKTKDANGDITRRMVHINKTITKKGHGFFKMSKPDKPNARNQEYIFTNKFVQISLS